MSGRRMMLIALAGVVAKKMPETADATNNTLFNVFITAPSFHSVEEGKIRLTTV